jgi:hypothetical protein
MPPRSPRHIGTDTETAVVRHLQAAGWPSAERRSLRGQLDAGDITGTPGICWSVKGGQAAKAASDGQIEAWLAEAEKQKANALGAIVFLLVVQRKGIGPANAGRWWAVMPGWQYESLCQRAGAVRPDELGGLGRWCFGDRGPIRMHLTQACALLNYAGYGDADG